MRTLQRAGRATSSAGGAPRPTGAQRAADCGGAGQRHARGRKGRERVARKSSPCIRTYVRTVRTYVRTYALSLPLSRFCSSSVNPSQHMHRILTYVRTYVRTCVRRRNGGGRRIGISAYVRTYVRSHFSTYVRTYVRICVRKYARTHATLCFPEARYPSSPPVLE